MKGKIHQKKTAINLAIKNAVGTLILTTDGDCRVGVNWLKSFADDYESTKFKLISGPVTFHDSNSIFTKLQIVEFASLIGTGASSIFLKRPNMCNGANLCYEKEAFLAVNGFEGYENQPSGDDEFLMHKIAEKYPNQIGFLKNVQSVVVTHAQANLPAFINQRRRWASKWSAYKNISTSILAVYILLINLFFVISVSILIFVQFYALLFLLISFRIIIEFLFIGSVLSFLNRKKNILFIPLVHIIYPFYVVYIGVASLQKGYKWKGRIY